MLSIAARLIDMVRGRDERIDRWAWTSGTSAATPDSNRVQNTKYKCNEWTYASQYVTDDNPYEDGMDARDEDGTDSAYKNISTWAEEDETHDHILTKIQEAHVVVSRPIPPPHDKLPSNPLME